jgi:hypothetical protein
MEDMAPTTPLGPDEIALLNSAFAMAPAWLQTELCQNVDVVYVDQDNLAPFGWSYWEVVDPNYNLNQKASTKTSGPGSGRGVFIAINRQVLNDSSASVYSLARRGLWELFKMTIITSDSRAQYLVDQIISGITATDDSSTGKSYPNEEAVLLLLAREMGFVTEHELAVQEAKANLPPGLLCTVDGNPTTFYAQSWSGYNNSQPEEARIHGIGSQRHDQATYSNTPPPPTVKKIANEASGNPGSAIRDMKLIYGTSTSTAASFQPEWADLLAAQAPIEDFVETYMLDAMSEAQDPNNHNNPLMIGSQVDFTDGTSSWDLIANPPAKAQYNPKAYLRAKMLCLGDDKSGLIKTLNVLPP